MTSTPTRPTEGSNPEMRGPHLKPFEERYENALKDPNIQSGLLEFQQSWRQTRDDQMKSLYEITGFTFENLRDKLTQAKDNVIAAPDEHVARFKANIEARGGKVVLVGSDAEANAYIAHLAHERGVSLVVKGKSMVSEEIGLNEALAHAGVEAVETDLGEWLLQRSTSAATRSRNCSRASSADRSTPMTFPRWCSPRASSCASASSKPAWASPARMR